MHWKISHDKLILYKIKSIEYLLKKLKIWLFTLYYSKDIRVLTLMNIVTIQISLIMYKL